jgi:hypothetical protein
MELSFWTFTYVFMGLAPAVQIRSGDYPGTTPNLSLHFNFHAMAVVVIGTICAWLGCTTRRRSEGRVPVVLVDEARVMLLAIAALAANTYYLTRVGPESLVRSRAELNNLEASLWTNSTISAIVGSLCTMPLLVAWLGLLQVRRQRKDAERRTPMVLPFIICCALLFSVNPISSARYLFGTVILSILAGLGAYSTPRRIRIMSVAFLLALIFIFPIADAFRREGSPDFSDLGPMNSLTSGDFDAFAQINNTMNYVSREGATWGRQALGVLLFWIPRTWWPEKPFDTGMLLAQYRRYDFENLSAPIWAELFINGGWIALIIGMLLLGIYMRRRDNNGAMLMARGYRPSVFGIILPFYMFILLRGSLLQAMAHLVVIAGCAAFITSRRDRIDGTVRWGRTGSRGRQHKGAVARTTGVNSGSDE